MSDDFENLQAGLTAPASTAFPITPHDVNELRSVTRAIYVGGAGSLTVKMRSGSAATFANVPAGSLLPIRARQVLTSSSATNLVGLA